jgi:hypothetical protein
MMDEERTMVRKLHKKTNRTHRIFILLVISLVILGVGAQSLEAGACERAAVYCMDEIISPGNMFWHAYCLNGYLFCKKYIE